MRQGSQLHLSELLSFKSTLAWQSATRGPFGLWDETRQKKSLPDAPQRPL